MVVGGVGGGGVGLQNIRERIDGTSQSSGLLVNILVSVLEERYHN